MDSDDQTIEAAVQQPAPTLEDLVSELANQVKSNRDAIIDVTRAVKRLQGSMAHIARGQMPCD